MIKIGFDVHGVIDAAPTFFSMLGLRIIDKGGEVHIITGKSWSEAVNTKLLSYCNGSRWWTHYFSIDDYLGQDKKLPFTIDTKGGRHYDDEPWNRAKAEYCQARQITLHIDDQPNYLKYFKTPTFCYKSTADNNETIKKMVEALLVNEDTTQNLVINCK